MMSEKVEIFRAANKTKKVSDYIVEQIRDAILSGSFKPGDRLASEKELIAQFEVSKATMREALRVLEGMGLIEIRKGIGGGVFIAEVDMKTTIHSIINFLHFKTVSIKDITMIRYLLEPPVARIAASKISEEDIRRLENMIHAPIQPDKMNVSKDIGFHRYLARTTGNPILILIMDFIDNILKDIKFQLKLGVDFYQKVAEAHSAILSALKKHDPYETEREIIKDLLWVGEYIAHLQNAPSFDPTTIPESSFNTLGDGEVLSSSRKEILKIVESNGLNEKLEDKDIIFERVGTGELYLLRLKEVRRSK